jgi:hypothetical protein
MSEHDDEPEGGRRGPGGRFRRMGRRMFGEGEDGRSILGDAKEVFGAVLEGGDKAKTEVVRAVAREVRNYLDELGLKDDIHDLITNYSLEVHASFNLRKLSEEQKAPKEPKGAKAAEKAEKTEDPPD